MGNKKATAYLCLRDCFVDRYYFAGEVVTDSRLYDLVPIHFKPLESNTLEECRNEANTIIPAEPTEIPTPTMADLYNSSRPKLFEPENILDRLAGKPEPADDTSVDDGIAELLGDDKPAKKSKVAKKSQAV